MENGYAEIPEDESFYEKIKDNLTDNEFTQLINPIQEVLTGP